MPRAAARDDGIMPLEPNDTAWPCRTAPLKLVALTLVMWLGPGCGAKCPAGTTLVGDVCHKQESEMAADGGVMPTGTAGTAANGVVASAGTSGGGPAAANVGGSGGTATNGAAAMSGGPANGGTGGTAGAQNMASATAGTSAAGASGAMVAEACKGNAGKAVCDGQGSLFVCNPDESVAMRQTCASTRLCTAGLASKNCAKCVPKEEFNCSGKTLQSCADDGQSFVKTKDCDTEALCNKVAGMCTSAVCAAGKTTCAGNTLTKCNADGTAFEKQTPCDPGTCDGTGGDCNMCEPGAKKCQGDMVATCNPTGQAFEATACPSGNKCVGLGMCGACANDGDCSAMTQGCKVGLCGAGYACTTKNAGNGIACTVGGKPGTCSSGSCQCTPQCSGKACGDDGCGGTCGTCPGGSKCSANQCVECTPTGGECASLTTSDGCTVGSCSAAGRCTTTTMSGQCHDSSGAQGQCSGGHCAVCKPNCNLKCGGASDGCSGTCNGSCGGSKVCSGTSCVDPPPGLGIYQACQTGGVQGECSANLLCTTVISSGFHCFPDANKVNCSAMGAAPFLGTVCIVTCTVGSNAGCPAGTACAPGGWCVPGVF
jgi:hypothetical protein